MKTKGQFYLMAAIVIIVVIISFAAVSNYAKKKAEIKIYDLGDELGIESEQVIDYGTYNALFSLCSLFSVFYELGLSHFSAQNISKDNTLFNKLFPSLFLTRLFALLFFPFFISFCGYLLGYEGKELWWLFLLAVSANLFHFALFFRAKLQAFQYFKFDAIASVLQKLLLIIIVVILFGYGIDIEKYIIV